MAAIDDTGFLIRLVLLSPASKLHAHALNYQIKTFKSDKCLQISDRKLCRKRKNKGEMDDKRVKQRGPGKEAADLMQERGGSGPGCKEQECSTNGVHVEQIAPHSEKPCR